MFVLVSLGWIVMAAPVSERQVLSAHEANACVSVLTSAVCDFARNLRTIEPDAISDIKLFSDAQRSRLVGLMVLLRGAEHEFALVENVKLKVALRDGCHEQRIVLQRALAALARIEEQPNAIDRYREVGTMVLEARPFLNLFKLRMESKPTVGEIVIPAP